MLPAVGCFIFAATVIAASGIAVPTVGERPVACSVKKPIAVMSRAWVPKGVRIIAIASTSISSA
jgi:hypothetical protein